MPDDTGAAAAAAAAGVFYDVVKMCSLPADITILVPP